MTLSSRISTIFGRNNYHFTRAAYARWHLPQSRRQLPSYIRACRAKNGCGRPAGKGSPSQNLHTTNMFNKWAIAFLFNNRTPQPRVWKRRAL